MRDLVRPSAGCGEAEAIRVEAGCSGEGEELGHAGESGQETRTGRGCGAEPSRVTTRAGS
jgi:hypothetical protein